MRNRKNIACASLALLMFLGCGASQKAADPQPLPGAESETAGLEDMHTHFEDINAIKSALMAGNLVSSRILAKELRLGFSGPAPKSWAPFIQRTTASAEMMEVTDELEMAARLAGTMANTCGDCHRDQGLAVIEHVAVAPPKEEDALEDFMTQHRWAADRMWEGLIGPSDEAWRAGALAIQNAELTKEEIGDRLVVTPEIESLLATLREDATAALNTNLAEERLILYGRFLAGCATCHSAMKNQRD